ncbi:uncharacterized protein LOC132039429 [Lycium ferocissimum]|uniref:uncharacterized protein LOC132039429 n=1 Tax=Lycium ferocissimum TaxID=112874 RepID=UPI002814C328|nr:uncharacterized protein LOC132039429 [Lycium ferocissimum]
MLLNLEELLKIEKPRYDLKVVQKTISIQYSDQLQIQEKNILQQLEKWLFLVESAMRQKSRIKWMKLGDQNTKYFIVVVKERSTKKQIWELQSLSGTKLTAPANIQDEIIKFYKGLMGSAANTLLAVDRTIMQQGLQLNHDQKMLLCAEVTEPEIKESLWSIGEDKSLMVDGYNACFFKKAWEVDKGDIIHAVKEFFETS